MDGKKKQGDRRNEFIMMSLLFSNELRSARNSFNVPTLVLRFCHCFRALHLCSSLYPFTIRVLPLFISLFHTYSFSLLQRTLWFIIPSYSRCSSKWPKTNSIKCKFKTKVAHHRNSSTNKECLNTINKEFPNWIASNVNWRICHSQTIHRLIRNECVARKCQLASAVSKAPEAVSISNSTQCRRAWNRITCKAVFCRHNYKIKTWWVRRRHNRCLCNNNWCKVFDRHHRTAVHSRIHRPGHSRRRRHVPNHHHTICQVILRRRRSSEILAMICTITCIHISHLYLVYPSIIWEMLAATWTCQVTWVVSITYR